MWIGGGIVKAGASAGYGKALLVLWWNARGLVLWWNARKDVRRVDSGMEEGPSLLKKGCGRGASCSARAGSAHLDVTGPATAFAARPAQPC